MAFSIPCVLFAGGKSSRMGRDKALLPFGGCDTLAEYQYRRLLPLFSSVYLSAKTDKFPFDAPLILDRADTYAPTAGLTAALKALNGDFFALSVDTPFVDERVFAPLMRLYEARKADAVVARSPSGVHPLCGIYTQALLPTLESMVSEGNHRLGRLLEIADTRYADFDDDALFFNMNTPDEYEKAFL